MMSAAAPWSAPHARWAVHPPRGILARGILARGIPAALHHSDAASRRRPGSCHTIYNDISLS